MKGKFKIPADVPAAACGRCIWFKLDRPDGWGKCRIWNDMYFYKCMVCEEYEFDGEIDLGAGLQTVCPTVGGIKEGGRS